MTTWMTATANLILLSLLGLYVIAAYASVWTRLGQAGFTRCMTLCRYGLHGYGFLILLMLTGEMRLLPFYLLQLAFFIMADILQRRVFLNGIETLYQNMMLLLSVGFLVLTRLSLDTAVKQFVMTVLAFCLCLLIPFILKRIPQLESLCWLYTLLGIGLLSVVLLLGSEVFGAKNWLTIHNFTFQPSEFVKLLFILSMAALLTRKTDQKYKNLLTVSIVAAVHVGLLALSNDFGGALIFFVVYLLMLFVVSADILFPIAALLSGTAAALLAYRYSGHIRERVMAWQDPFSCIEDEGYQIAQSLFAIGSGEWFGTGLTEGMPKTVPVVKSDFIFAAISEELGAVFAALLLLIYINCIIWMLTLALERKQPFFFAVTTGAAALFGVQLILNVGGVIKLIPSTGVTLAFISYGGSSLFSTMFLFQGIQGMRGAEQTKKKAGKDPKRTGQQLRMVAVCSMLLLALCATFAFFLGFTVREAKKNYFNDYNQRIRAMERSMQKGKILSADGTILAQSIRGENGELYRLYPHGEQTVFITGQMLMGRTGLEDSLLEELYSVGLSYPEKLLRKANGVPLEGNRAVTTIRMDLQQAAWEALHGYRGTIGVLEVNSGRILAAVSSPGYNPNMVSVEWESLLTREDAPFLNRMTSGLYPPGSTFKLVTALAYLEEHGEEDFSYVCTGTDRIRNTTVHCYKEKAHGEQTISEAMANSCNTAFAYMGEQISLNSFRKVAEQLGFGRAYGGTLQYRATNFPLTEQSTDAAYVQATFGQGELLMTPFHNLMIAAGIAGDGVLHLPYLLERVENSDGKLLEQYGSVGAETLMSAEKAGILETYMVAASKGKFPRLEEVGITVAGKTGSAEFAEEEPAHAWYICYAPADNPQIAVCVLLENCGTGSLHAMPAAAKVLEEYFFGD